MKNLYSVVLALIIDLIIGDPAFPFHPVRLIGLFINYTENVFRKLSFSERFSGTSAAFSLLAIMVLLFYAAAKVIALLPAGSLIFSVIVFYFSFAVKDLTKHGRAVEKALSKGCIEEARIKVSYLVSRETDKLEADQIIQATVESLSENTGDSIIGPIFWGLLLGPAGSFFYRAINTMDSMWGYKNERYIFFGRTAAKLDDLVNFIPARLTGLCLCLASFFTAPYPLSAWKTMFREHSHNKSPNAGYPEAAVAGALGILLGGPGIYSGTRVEKAYIGKPGRLKITHISDTIRIVYAATFIFLLISVCLILLVKYFSNR